MDVHWVLKFRSGWETVGRLGLRSSSAAKEIAFRVCAVRGPGAGQGSDDERSVRGPGDVISAAGPGGWFHQHAVCGSPLENCPALAHMGSLALRQGESGAARRSPVTAGRCTCRTSTLSAGGGISCTKRPDQGPRIYPIVLFVRVWEEHPRSSGRPRTPALVPHSPSPGVSRKSSWQCPAPSPPSVPWVSCPSPGTWPSPQQ